MSWTSASLGSSLGLLIILLLKCGNCRWHLNFRLVSGATERVGRGCAQFIIGLINESGRAKSARPLSIRTYTHNVGSTYVRLRASHRGRVDIAAASYENARALQNVLADFRYRKIDDRREGADTAEGNRSSVSYGFVRRRDRLDPGLGRDGIRHGIVREHRGIHRHKRHKKR